MSESNPIVRFRARPTRALAIRAFCAQCMGCTETSLNPGFRSMIRDCSSPNCALYSFRPFQRNDDDEHDANRGGDAA